MKKIRINKSRFAIFVLVIVVAVTGIYGLAQTMEKMRYERQLDGFIKRNYQDLVLAVENITNDLSKLMVSANDKQNLRLLTRIWEQADAASQSLVEIPIQNEHLRKTQKFINQLADFSYAMTQKSVKGETLFALAESDMDTMRQLYDYSLELCEGLYRVDPAEVGLEAWKQQAKSGRVRLAGAEQEQEAREVFARVEQGEEPEQEIDTALEETGQEMTQNPFDAAMTEFEGRLSNYPKMLYDGPFSDHMQEGGIAKIEGRLFTQQEAKQEAAAFIDPSGGYSADNLRLLQGTDTEEDMTYLFEYHKKKNATCYISITKKGGKVLSLMCDELSSKSNLSRKQAEKIAEQYVKERGIHDVVLTYSQKTGNTALVNYAAQQDGITMYPDLIKVSVSLHSGEIVGYEAAQYLINHKKRDITPATVSREQAAGNIGKNGVVEAEKLCYIPNDYGGEVFCHELRVRSGHDYFLFYINAQSGELEKEFRLLLSENGVLTV